MPDGVGDANEQAIKVVLAGFRDLIARNVHVVQEQLLFFHELVQVEPKRRHVHRQIGQRFLERDEHAGLIELRGAAHQELESKQGLA